MPMTFRDAFGIGRYRESKRYDPYLTYYDVTLSYADIDSLNAEQWLTDNIITFWEEYLEVTELKKHPGNSVVLLRPSIVELLKHTPDKETIQQQFEYCKTASHIFLPVNNSEDTTRAEGGSHWSLLVIGVTDRIAFHYDSMSSGNVDFARMIVAKLQQLFEFQIRFAHLDDTPSQINGWDCGIHVCWAMKHLLVRRLLACEKTREVDMSLGGKVLNSCRMRDEMRRILEKYQRESDRKYVDKSNSLSDSEAVVDSMRRIHRKRKSGTGRDESPKTTGSSAVKRKHHHSWRFHWKSPDGEKRFFHVGNQHLNPSDDSPSLSSGMPDEPPPSPGYLSHDEYYRPNSGI